MVLSSKSDPWDPRSTQVSIPPLELEGLACVLFPAVCPAPTTVSNTWQALKCLFYEQNCWVSKALLTLDAEISKLPWHTECLGEKKNGIWGYKQAVLPLPQAKEQKGHGPAGSPQMKPN